MLSQARISIAFHRILSYQTRPGLIHASTREHAVSTGAVEAATTLRTLTGFNNSIFRTARASIPTLLTRKVVC